MTWIFGLALCLSALVAALPASAACGTDPAPCTIPTGTYEAEVPPDSGASMPAVIFLHGYGSSGADTISNRGMVDTLIARGYAVIAPSGVPLEDQGGPSWAFAPLPGARDDIAFVEAVRDDAVRRFGLDRNRILLAGFSIGGSMVNYLACADPTAFAAYAPVSGGFWRPHPKACAGPVRLLHTHGWIDTTVPLEGLVLSEGPQDNPGVFVMGDIFHTMEIWRAANGCNQLRADDFAVDDGFWLRSWTRCAPGTALELALFPGDHMIPLEWAQLALDWFEALPPRPGAP